MDIIFEHNPRKKIPQDVMNKWIEERGLRHADAGAESVNEKKTELTHEEAV
jgi:hypothetical protein